MARLTIAQAAARLDVSPDSIRRRLRKKDLHGEQDERGQWWLDIPDNMPPEAATPSVEERLASAMLAPAQRQPMQPDPALVDTLRAQVADLMARLDRVEGEAQAARARIAAVLEERDLARQATADARVQAASAEGEARALREAIAELRRPAWRRWLGLL